MQKIIVDFMEHGGHTCITADDGIETITLLKNNPVDFVILDIMMPHLDGFTVCRLVREMYNVPIIFLTAKSTDTDKLKGYEYGADDYIAITNKKFYFTYLAYSVFRNRIYQRLISTPNYYETYYVYYGDGKRNC